ncbi:MAG TPA: VWA domain-containing protein [Candidatus Binatia bacterium]|nr:VWA domain-containing protein [Candidatus Binatia bacterium]
MNFFQPWLLLLLAALPALAWWRGKRGQQAAFLYSSVQLVKNVANLRRSRVGQILAAMRWLTLGLFIVGLARPQLIESEAALKASGIDIVVALDLSGSMESEDFELRGERVNRLVIAKDVLKKFVDRRPSDRIGLVAFAGKPYIAAPLTLDHDFLEQNIDRLQLHSIEDGTAIGSALAAAVNRLRDIESKSKIVILMTDGQNNAGKIPPLTAAEAAEALKIKVYTIGVGTHGTAPMPRMDVFGRKRYVQVPVDIDEDTLKIIADKTGGKYYRADSSETLKAIYDQIDKMETTEREMKKYVRVEELFPWAVVPGFGLLLLEILLSHTIWRRLP